MKANPSLLWFGNGPGSPGAFWGKAREGGRGEGDREEEEDDLLSQGRAGSLCLSGPEWLGFFLRRGGKQTDMH